MDVQINKKRRGDPSLPGLFFVLFVSFSIYLQSHIVSCIPQSLWVLDSSTRQRYGRKRLVKKLLQEIKCGSTRRMDEKKGKKEDKARIKIDMIYNREGERELREVWSYFKRRLEASGIRVSVENRLNWENVTKLSTCAGSNLLHCQRRCRHQHRHRHHPPLHPLRRLDHLPPRRRPVIRRYF